MQKTNFLCIIIEVEYYGRYTNKSIEITMVWPEKKRNVLEGEEVDKDGKDTKDKGEGKEKNMGLNGGEVDINIKDKYYKKIKEDNEKDKIQEKEVMVKSLLIMMNINLN